MKKRAMGIQNVPSISSKNKQQTHHSQGLFKIPAIPSAKKRLKLESDARASHDIFGPAKTDVNLKEVVVELGEAEKANKLVCFLFIHTPSDTTALIIENENVVCKCAERARNHKTAHRI